MDNLTKTEEIIKSKKTSKTYKTMEDFLKENSIEDLQKDVSITISKGLDLFQKVMNKK
jgi:ASC-1-like (ASCH) protein